MFEKGLVLFAVIKHIYDIETDTLLDIYGRIFNAWENMRGNGMLNMDGIFGHSSIRHNQSVELGAIIEPNDDNEFIEVLLECVDLFQSMGLDYAGVVRRHVQLFPTDRFTNDTLEPVLILLG